MVVSNGSAELDHQSIGDYLDVAPPVQGISKIAVGIANGIKGKVGRGTIGIHVRETAGESAVSPGDFLYRCHQVVANRLVEARKPIPGHSSFKCVGDDAEARKAVSIVGHAYERIPP